MFSLKISYILLKKLHYIHSPFKKPTIYKVEEELSCKLSPSEIELGTSLAKQKFRRRNIIILLFFYP
jgi:hypothetical protein